MICYYLSKEQYQTYINIAFKDIGFKLRNLSNMHPVEKWISPFNEDDGIINFQ